MSYLVVSKAVLVVAYALACLVSGAVGAVLASIYYRARPPSADATQRISTRRLERVLEKMGAGR